MLLVRPISPEETHPLRHAVLRPRQPLSAMVYPNDDGAETLHVGAFVDGALVGIASIYREGRPGRAEPHAWRLRGMVTTPDARRTGCGRAMLDALLAHARANNGRILWCNGRVTAAQFYFALGFAQEGEPFELPGIGPHLLMHRAI